MHDLALMAAQEWARTNVTTDGNPIEFGHGVALAYLACRDTAYHAGDKAATAAALSALSLPDEILQALALLSSLSESRTKSESA